YFAFATAGFETITPVIEPLPNTSTVAPDKALGVATSIMANAGPASPVADKPLGQTSNTAAGINTPDTRLDAARITRLVRVEIWNLVVGDEKSQILEKARLLGEPLPSKDKWHNWRVATGIAENTKNPITFLI